MKCLYHPSDTFCFRTKGGLSLSKIYFCFCCCCFFLGGGKGGGRGGLVFLFQLPIHMFFAHSEAFMIYGNRADISLFIFHLFILTLHSN